MQHIRNFFHTFSLTGDSLIDDLAAGVMVAGLIVVVVMLLWGVHH
jgi:hypothetical protein